MAKLNKNVIAALKKIQETGRATQAVGEPLVKQGLIEVNTADVNEAGEAAARLTAAGLEGIGQPTGSAPATPSKYGIITNAVLPESKRGFGRKEGESKYPFADLNVGGMFFVPNADVAKGDALKSLTSAVSNANNKYRTETGQTEQKTRTKRGEGNKAVVDAEGNKVKETVTVPVYKQERKFSIRGVKAGVKYGEWEAPADGALIARIA